MTKPQPGNILAQESSPYLLQHKDNPVHWRPWGPEALEDARTYNKPILLSVGYAACHWCHVMAHESFENPDIAGQMNELFINIKVDREERPDIDMIYQRALQLLGEQGGWPLTIFLTPSGEPFWGGTYFPPDARYGRPGFPQVLQEIHRIFHQEPEKITSNREGLMKGLRDQVHSQGGEIPLSLTVLDDLAEKLLTHIDRLKGGFNGAPKFPQVSTLDFLWRVSQRLGHTDMAEAVTHSLNRICEGGIYDHLGGGFARYSVDEDWLVPHFEKMLYDNALLLRLMAQVWAKTQDPLLAQRIDEVVAWLKRDMLDEGGAFYASFDADSEGVEGKFYVWTEADIDGLLAKDAALFKQTYEVTAGGNWEGNTILNRLHLEEVPGAQEEELLKAARAKLLEARAERIPPARDDKILADWNGLMIAALADAAATLNRPDYLDLAIQAFDFITNNMTLEGGRLLHSHCGGAARIAGMLDDYAFMTDAAISLYEITGDENYLDWARGWAGHVDEFFIDKTGGGYFLTPSDSEALIVRMKSAADAATPSGNGIMAQVFLKLALITDDLSYREKAEQILQRFIGDVLRNAFPLGSLFNALEIFERPVLISLYGEEEADLTDLEITLHRRAPSGRAIRHGSKDAPSGTGVTVCIGPVCSKVLLTPEEIALEFDQRG